MRYGTFSQTPWADYSRPFHRGIPKHSARTGPDWSINTQPLTNHSATLRAHPTRPRANPRNVVFRARPCTPCNKGDTNPWSLRVRESTVQVFCCLAPNLVGVASEVDARTHLDGHVRRDEEDVLEPLHAGHDDSRVVLPSTQAVLPPLGARRARQHQRRSGPRHEAEHVSAEKHAARELAPPHTQRAARIPMSCDREGGGGSCSCCPRDRQCATSSRNRHENATDGNVLRHRVRSGVPQQVLRTITGDKGSASLDTQHACLGGEAQEVKTNRESRQERQEDVIAQVFWVPSIGQARKATTLRVNPIACSPAKASPTSTPNFSLRCFDSRLSSSIRRSTRVHYGPSQRDGSRGSCLRYGATLLPGAGLTSTRRAACAAASTPH